MTLGRRILRALGPVRWLVGLVRRAYAGAARDTRTLGWRTSGKSGNAETRDALPLLRERAHDLVRNQPHARQAIGRWVDFVVGSGITGKVRTGPTAAAVARANALWAVWQDEPGADGCADFGSVMRRAVWAMLEGGDALVLMRWARAPGASGVPLLLQVLESEHLCPTVDALAGVPNTVQGVERDALGRTVAFHVYAEHPGEVGQTGGLMVKTIRYSAANAVHLVDAGSMRPGQVRGVPLLAPVVRELRDLADFVEAETAKAQAAACLGLVVTSPNGDYTPDGRKPEVGVNPTAVRDAGGNVVEQLQPGGILYTTPDTTVTTVQPAATSGTAEFIRSRLQAVAAGVGMPYELLTGDLSGANYSSYRAGYLPFRVRVESLQWQVVVPACRRVGARFIEAAVAAGLLPAGDYGWDWTPPRMPEIDRAKELAADLVEARMLRVSTDELIRRNGDDPDAVLAAVVAWNAKADAAGLVSDADPRKTTNGGMFQAAPADPAGGKAW